MIVAGAVVLPVLWLVPEWIGSGQPFGAGAQARSEPSWSLSRLDHPWLELLGRAHETLGPALEAGVAAALVLAWRGRDRTELALGGVAVAWVALVALMTQSGFSGNARYLLPATVIACLLTGVALGHLLRTSRRSVPAAVPRSRWRRWWCPPRPTGCPRSRARRERPSAPRSWIATWPPRSTAWAAPTPSWPAGRRPSTARSSRGWRG